MRLRGAADPVLTLPNLLGVRRGRCGWMAGHRYERIDWYNRSDQEHPIQTCNNLSRPPQRTTQRNASTAQWTGRIGLLSEGTCRPPVRQQTMLQLRKCY